MNTNFFLIFILVLSQYISFQIAIAQQYKNGKAYVVFSYEKNNINSRSVNKQVLIGLTDGKKSITNAYSNMDGSNTSPYSIFNVIGNCSMRVLVFEN